MSEEEARREGDDAKGEPGGAPVGAPAAGGADGAPADPSAAEDVADSAPEGAADDMAERTEEAGDAAEETPLQVAERERGEYLELAQRTKAEFDNYRRRMSGEVEAASERGRAELAKGLIEVIDNLERALAAIEVEPEAAITGEAEVDGPIEQGVVLTYRDLCGTLSRAGVESYAPVGEQFDPTWHEALQSRPEPEAAGGSVVEVLQRGYRLGERVLRPARVVVAA
ncbi:MAG TPA: nucleotide exchange factor GrpE [Solirubrobacterales bacterium]|nr:nucleotide exchange factor GrpE [Solirubrobacterales bacterium]